MFIFKCVITLSVFYNVIAMVNETSEGDITTKMSTQNINSKVRSKRQRNLGYYDYLHYILDKHAHSADEHLEAHKPVGPYRPYEMHIFPHGLTHSSGEIRDHYDDHLQQDVNIFSGFGRAVNCFRCSGIHRAINTHSPPGIERTARRMTYSSGTGQAIKPRCSSIRGRTITKPKLRYKSQERNRGTIAKNCTFPHRKSKKTAARKQLRASHQNASQHNSHLANQNSQQNLNHIVVLQLRDNNCSCSKYTINSAEGSLIGYSGSSRGSQVITKSTAGVSAGSSAATGSSEPDSTDILGSDVEDVSTFDDVTASSTNVTTNNSAFAVTVSDAVPFSDQGPVITPAPSEVTDSTSTLATKSSPTLVFGSTFVTTPSSSTVSDSTAVPRSSEASTPASVDTASASASTTVSSTTISPNAVSVSSTTISPNAVSVSSTTPSPSSALPAGSETTSTIDFATDSSLVPTSSSASTFNPTSAFETSPDSTLTPTSDSVTSTLSPSVPDSATTSNPMSSSIVSSVSPDVESTVANTNLDSHLNAVATTTTTSTPVTILIITSSEVTPSVSDTVPSSKTVSASVTGIDSDAASGTTSMSALNSSDTTSSIASSVSNHVVTSTSEFKSNSNSEFSSHSNSSVISGDSQQSPAFGREPAPSSTHPPALARKATIQDDFEPIPIPMDDQRSTFVLSAAQDPTAPVNQSNIESGSLDLMSFLDNLERIDNFSHSAEDSSRTSTTNSFTQSQTSTSNASTQSQASTQQFRNLSNISNAETRVASSNWQNMTSNQRNVVEQQTDTVSGDSNKSEFLEDQRDHIVGISGTSMDLNATNSKDMQHDRHNAEDIKKLQPINDDIPNNTEPSNDIFFDDISEAEVLRENNPHPIFEGTQDGDGTSTFFVENVSSSSFHHDSPVEETAEDVSNVPIKSNGKFRALQFGSGSARTVTETAENNQDTLELESDNSRSRLNDMTGTGSRFVNILRSPNERASEATFAEPLVPGGYSTKMHEFRYKSRSPPSIYWHRIEPKFYTTNRHLKELRPFESADFEDVHFSQDCVDSDEFDEEPRSAELKPPFAEIFNCNTHLT